MNGTLTDLQKRVLNEIKVDIKQKRDLNIRMIAQKNFVSPSFLVKLSKKLGYSGYKEMIFSLRMDIEAHKYDSVEDHLYLTKVENLIFQNYSDELVLQFREYMEGAKDAYIYAAGYGYSNIILDYMSRKCVRRGYRFIHSENLSELACYADDSSIGLLISASGETENVLEVAENCKRRKHKTIAFTQNRNSRLGRMVDLPIVISKFEGENTERINVFISYTLMAFEILLKKNMDV